MSTLNPTLTLSIDRAALSLAPLVLSANDDEHPLGIIEFVEPPLVPRIEGIDDTHLHGTVPLRWSYNQSILAFTVAPRVETETAAQAVLEELRAAVTQALRYQVTQTISDAPPKVWTCNPGQITPTGRDLLDLRHHWPLRTVSLPCHPIPA